MFDPYLSFLAIYVVYFAIIAGIYIIGYFIINGHMHRYTDTGRKKPQIWYDKEGNFHHGHRRIYNCTRCGKTKLGKLYIDDV